MKYALSVVEKFGKTYVTGCRLVSDEEASEQNPSLIINEPIKGDFVNQQGKYQFILTLEGEIILDPEVMTNEDIEVKRKRLKVESIKSRYSADDEFKLLNQAIAALMNKEELPDAYKEYRACIDTCE